MGHLLLEELFIKNFRGYTENIFSFFKDKETKNGIIVLGGPNGYGKTSFFDAIEWCLTGTVRRLNDELEARLKGDTANAFLQKGILRNILTEDEVVVSLKLSIDGKSVTFTRSFGDRNEREGLVPEKTVFRITGDGDSLVAAVGQFLEEIKGSFYDRYTCSYEKSLNMYRKGRKDIYQMFSTFFGSNTKLETMINNLEGNQERGTKKVMGIIDGIEERYKELKDAEKVAKTYYEGKKSEKDKLEKDYKQVSGYTNLIKVYPSYNIYDGEIHALNLEEISDKAEQAYKTNNQITNLTLISERPILGELRQHQRYYNSSQYLKNFIQDIVSPFRDREKDIEIAQKTNIELLRKEQSRIENSRRIIRRITKPSQAIHIGKFLARQSWFIQYHEANLLFGILSNLKRDQKIISNLSIIRNNYESQAPMLNALRALVDHIEGLEVYRKNNKECPLCGSSELFFDADIALNAKHILGEEDKERARVEGEYNKKNNQIQEQLAKFKSIVSRYCDFKNKEITKIQEIVEKLSKLKNSCKKYNISFNELNDSMVRRREQKVKRIVSSLDNRIENSTENLLDKITQSDGTIKYIYNEKGSPYTKEMFNILDEGQKAKTLQNLIFNYFLELNKVKLSVRYSLDIMSSIEERIKILKEMSKGVIGIEALANCKISLEEAVNSWNNAKTASKSLADKLDVLKSLSRDLKAYRANKERAQTEQIIDPVNKLYRRITRHTNFKQIALDRSGKTSSKSELRIIHEIGDDTDCFISNVFSAGQVSTLSIAIFLATAIKHQDSLLRCYFMDDPIQSMDDLNVLSFIDLLRVELQPSNIKKNGFFDQLFISTCDEDFENLVKHKMKSFDVNCCSFHFNRYGNYICD